jgi:hypothetical protein
MENNKEYEMICFKDRLYKKLKKYLVETSPPYLSINKILNLMKQVYVNENQLLEHLQLGINLPDFNNNIEEVITNLENLQLIKDLLNFVDIDINLELDQKIRNLNIRFQHLKQELKTQSEELNQKMYICE